MCEGGVYVFTCKSILQCIVHKHIYIYSTSGWWLQRIQPFCYIERDGIPRISSKYILCIQNWLQERLSNKYTQSQLTKKCYAILDWAAVWFHSQRMTFHQTRSMARLIKLSLNWIDIGALALLEAAQNGTGWCLGGWDRNTWNLKIHICIWWFSV